MGREIKKVAVDFDWPLKKIWDGFKNPFYQHLNQCEVCKGSGYSPRAKEFQDQWYGYVEFNPAMTGSTPFPPTHPAILKLAHRNAYSMRLYYQGREWSWEDYEANKDSLPMDAAVVRIEAQRLCDECYNNHWSHHLSQDDVDAMWEDEKAYRHSSFRERFATKPTAQEVNEWSLSSDRLSGSCASYVIIKARCKKEGIEDLCPNCQGEGNIWETQELKEQSENWKPTEPPAGEAFQIWETVSEGSPVSPPFLKAEDLANWMLEHDSTVTKGTTFEQWMSFITETQWAPSLMSNSEGALVPGVQVMPPEINGVEV